MGALKGVRWVRTPSRRINKKFFCYFDCPPEKISGYDPYGLYHRILWDTTLTRPTGTSKNQSVELLNY